MRLSLVILLFFVTVVSAGESSPLDRLLEDHWKREGLTPTSLADDRVLFRRLMLDLTGRVPTTREVEHFAADKSADRYPATVRRLLAGPEFAWHFGTVLDEIIQGRAAGNDAFIGYLRRSLSENKTWDAIFREVMVGPWDSEARKPSALFLNRRASDLDVLTVDATRAFFGVDISCARCHNHPLVKDWKREHYYGMAAFLVRTTGGKGTVGEKPDGEAKFAGKDGKERTVPMMFLSGKTLAEPTSPMKGAKPPSRREALVRIALDEKTFFSRAFVNRMWEYFHGRGLVEPVDQIHSGNPASIPSLLDRLASDFTASGYNVRQLSESIVLGRAYRLDGHAKPDKLPEHFAAARLRPLSPRQFARSLTVAMGNGGFEGTPEKLAALDKQAAELTVALDPRTADFQSSAREALFVSNADSIRKLIAAGSLTEKLSMMRDDRAAVRAATLAILSRSPTAEELADLESWLARHKANRQAACEDLVWALLASAEFRFNH